MSELEEIVHVLEDSRLPLEELVEKYERGALLLGICQKRLNGAQQRIELITRRGTEAPVLVSMAESSSEPASAPAAPKASRKSSSPENSNSDEIRLF